MCSLRTYINRGLWRIRTIRNVAVPKDDIVIQFSFSSTCVRNIPSRGQSTFTRVGLFLCSSYFTYINVELECRSVTHRDVLPIPQLPNRLKELGLAILVLQVIGVFPS